MRRSAPRALSFAVTRVRDELMPATTLGRVQACWAAAAGEALERVSQPVSERGGLVTVACEDSMWASELQMLGPELLERLRAALPDLPELELRFKAGDFRTRR